MFVKQRQSAYAPVNSVTSHLKEWLVKLFVNSIERVSEEEDRLDVIRWLALSREVVGSDKPMTDKLVSLYALMNSRKAVQIVVHGVTQAVKNFKTSNLPLAVKISAPVTLLAAPFIGGQAAGVAAFGGAIGLPVLLLIFLGTSGITAVIEASLRRTRPSTYLGVVLALIAHDEALRRVRGSIRDGGQGKPSEPVRFNIPEEERALRESLLAMDPYDFEKHIMSFFPASMFPVHTIKSNDKGIDGFARHTEGLIVVQCKHYSPDNPVGRPAIQQFRGVIEENDAWRGYFVTTSRFTADALDSAVLSTKLVLVDMDELVHWHKEAPAF
jgi:restriction system protein